METYKHFSSPATITSAVLLDSTILATFSVRSIERQCKRTLVREFSPNGSSFPVDLGDAQCVSISPSLKKQLVLRCVKEATGSKRFVEVYDKSGSVKEYNVTEIHGDFYVDGYNYFLLNLFQTPLEVSPGPSKRLL